MKLREWVENTFVSKDIFNARLSPIEKIVYGGITIILTSVLVAGLALIIRNR